MSYHSIYFPFTDIYLLAGPEVFEELQAKEEGQRNLLVFPSMFGKELDPDTKTGNTWGMEGGKQVNRFLKNLKGVKLADSEARQEMSQDHVGQNQEPTKGITIYRVNDGLDIAYIDYANFSSDVFKVSRLIDRVEDIWRAEKGPIILTTVDRYHTKYGSRGIEVQEPHFMVVNEDIVNQGIIEGTPELLAELYGRSREVPIGTVEEALQKEWMKHLFNNQFVRFVDPSKRSYVYGRITGELQRSKSGTRVTGIDNVVLRLLQDKEYSMKLKMGTAQMDTLLGIRPLNMEQYLVMRYGLMNLTDVPLIFLVGQQGSGKTILAYAAAVDQILVYDKQYRAQRGMAEDNDKSGFHDRMVLFKPHEIMGGRKREVGFQPGDL
ncbi:TPA: hypothetical protein HA265_06205, partial [Candidatus Woesearchaeota archaeon]|nr:hypothetical protein [Candidatus Woesearchaeota archaeon]